MYKVTCQWCGTTHENYRLAPYCSLLCKDRGSAYWEREIAWWIYNIAEWYEARTSWEDPTL